MTACGVLALLGASREVASAEGATQSMSVWRIEGTTARVKAWVPVAVARRFGASDEAGSAADADSFARAGLLAGDHLARRLVLVSASGSCAPVGSGPGTGQREEGWIVLEWNVSCPTDHGFRLRDDAFFDDSPTHAHLARVEWQGRDGRVGGVVEKVLTAGDRVFAPRHSSQASPGGRGSVGSLALAVLEQLRGGLPMWMAFLAAAFASALAQPTVWPVAIASALGLAAGALAPAGAASLAVPVAAAATLALALALFVREGASGWLAAAIYVVATCAALAQSALPWALSLSRGSVLLGLALLTCASRRSALATLALAAAAGLIVGATTTVAAAAPLAPLSERLANAAALGVPALATVAIAKLLDHRARRRVASALAAAAVAVSIAWLACP